MEISKPEILLGIKEMDEEAISLITPPLKELLNNLLMEYGVNGLTAEELMSWIFAEVSCGKIPENLSCKPLTYLNGIGRNLIFQDLKRKKREISMDSNSIDNFRFPEDIFDDEEKIMCIRLRACIDKMSPSCKDLLKIFFINDDTDEIANSLKYNNSDTLYSRKNQCISKLKMIIQEHDPWLAQKLKK